MALTIEIAGVDKTDKLWLPSEADAIDATFIAGAQESGTVRVYDLLGAIGYRPTIGQTFLLKDSATELLAGILADIQAEGFTDLDTGHISTLTVNGWQSYYNRYWITAEYAAGTSLRAVAQDILDESDLTTEGFTIDAGAMGSVYANGPVLSATLTLDCFVEEGFNRLQSLTGFVYRTTTAKAMKWREPAWESCGFSASDASDNVDGKVQYRQRRSSNYANTVRVTAGPSGPGEVIANVWSGDGVTTYFYLQGVNVRASNVWPGVVNVDGVDYPMYGPGGTPGGNGIEWDYSVYHGALNFVGTAAAIATGATTITLQYVPLYPFTITAENSGEVATHGRWYAQPVTMTDVLDYDEAVAAGEAIVRQRIAAPEEVVFRCEDGPAYIGQSIALSFAEHLIAGTFMIVQVDLGTFEDGTPSYTYTCLGGSELAVSWLDYFRGQVGGSSGGGTVVVGSGGSSSTTVVTAPIDLGGSRNTAIAPVGATEADRWTNVVNYWPTPITQDTSLRFRAFVTSRAGASVTVKTRLWDITAAAAVAGSTSAAITPAGALVFTEVSAAVAVLDGHEYAMQITNGTSGEGVLGIGKLESL